jgi:hypothetical protein
MKTNIFRIAAAFLVLISIIWGYWWITWSLAIVFLFVFPSYYEIIFWGVMYDALYGLPIAQFWGFAFVFSAASIALFLIAHTLRKLLLAYESTI